jgi:hypothetical protein
MSCRGQRLMTCSGPAEMQRLHGVLCELEQQLIRHRTQPVASNNGVSSSSSSC